MPSVCGLTIPRHRQTDLRLRHTPDGGKQRSQQQVSWLAVRCGHSAFPVSQWPMVERPLAVHSCGGSRVAGTRTLGWRVPVPIPFYIP